MANQAKADRAVRLTFSYEGDKVELVGQQRVNMIPPPSDPVKTEAGFMAEPESGFWYEVKDANGGTIYRRVIHSPIEYNREVFTNEPEKTIQRVTIDEPQGVFTVVIPDIEEADAVSLHSSPTESGAASFEAAREINTFKLTYK